MTTVEWQTTCTALKQRGALLLETEEWSDCKLLVGPEAVPIRAHKLMLAMASPVFEAMFFIENREDQVVFIIPDVDPRAFEAMINYIYTENINISTYKEAHNLFLAAHKFLILQLARVCMEYMSYNITMENACSAYDVGHRFQDQTLMNESLLVLKQNIKGILWSKIFEEADINTVAAIFGIPDLQVDDMELYKALLRYAAVRKNRKRSASPEPNETGQDALNCRTLRKALKNIRFLTFTMEEFAKGPAQSGLFTREEALSILVNIAGGETPMPPGFTDSRQHRCQRPPTPLPVSTTPRGTLRVTIPDAMPYNTFKRSVTSPRVIVAGRPWALTVMPYQVTRTGTASFDMDNMFLAAFLKCLDTSSTVGWSCLARVEFSLLANNTSDSGRGADSSGSTGSSTDTNTNSGHSANSTNSSSMSSATSNKKNKTETIEKTFNSNQNEWGVVKLARWLNVTLADSGYKHGDALVIEAHVAILNVARATHEH